MKYTNTFEEFLINEANAWEWNGMKSNIQQMLFLYKVGKFKSEIEKFCKKYEINLKEDDNDITYKILKSQLSDKILTDFLTTIHRKEGLI